MKGKLLMNAIGGISDSHIVEFANVKPRKKNATLLVKIVSVAACLAVAIIAISMIGDPTDAPGGPVSAIPYVKINDMVYIIDPNHTNTTTNRLSDDYVVIGKVERNPFSDKSQEIVNGDAAGCKVGDEIFQSPDLPNEVYVYTTLFSGSGEYRYVRFVHKD